MYTKNVALEIERPQELFDEINQSFEVNYFGENNITYMAANMFLKHKQPNQIREALMKGYVEMSHINLTICSECLQAEYEAQHMVERLVSGG